MDSNEIYSTPRSDLGDEPLQKTKYGFFKRFYITFLWGLPVYMFFVILGTPADGWLNGAIGSAMFSFASGLLAMLIPVQRKSVFVTISLVAGIVVAILIGMKMAG